MAQRRILADPRERRLAGRAGGLLYIAGGLSSVGLGLGSDAFDRWTTFHVALSVAGVLWGALSLWVIDWERWPAWPLVAGTFGGLAIGAFGTASTGAAESPLRLQVLFVLVYAAYFFPVRIAAAAAVGTAAAACLPLVIGGLYADDHHGLQAIVEGVTLLSVGLVGVSASSAMRSARRAAEDSARRAEAVGVVATSVASEQPLEEVLSTAAERLAGLLGADGASVVRFDGSETATVMGVWTVAGAPTRPVGTAMRRRPDGEYARMLADGGSMRVDAYDDGSQSAVARLGYGCFVAVPIVVAGEVWGALSASTLRPGGLPADVDHRLADFARSVALAVSASEDRRRLTALALTDSLTGLANRRAFHDRLEEEVQRARRHGRVLTLALIDLDAFKAINDGHGHAAGDRALCALAAALREAVREDDVVGRLGGDEFAVLLPEADSLETLRGLERARAALARIVAEEPFDLAFSAGLCDLQQAGDAEGLERQADLALYEAKHRGGGLSWVFDREVAARLDAEAALERRGRAEALGGLHSLARAIDAKDHLTREHSLRVARVAEALARALGWPDDRVRLLHEAGVLHDVGKIGVPDRILLKPGALDPEETETVRAHAALGAQIVDGVLTPEQVSWVRSHHERVDGRGYPDGLGDAEVSEGAAILAVADAFDAMTSARPYGVPLTLEEGLAECRRCAGSQFRPSVVEALERLELATALAPAR